VGACAKSNVRVDRNPAMGYNDSMNKTSKDNLKWAAKILMGVCIVFAVLTAVLPPAHRSNSDTLWDTCRNLVKETSLTQIKFDIQCFKQSLRERGIKGTYNNWRDSLEALHNYSPSWGSEFLLIATPEELKE